MAPKSRLSADPSVGVGDLQSAFKAFFEEEGSRDLHRLLKPPIAMTWKSAPLAEWLGEKSMANLFKRLFDVHSNGVLTGKKLKSAIFKEQAVRGRLNFTKKHDSDFVDDMDEQLRIAAALYRDLKKDSGKYLRCTRKASLEEKEQLDEVLRKLQLGSELPPEQVETEEERASPVRPEPSSVFSRVLQKEPSAPESPKSEAFVVVKKETSSSSSLSLQVSGSRPQLRRQLAFLEMDKKEEEEMLKWMSTSVDVSKKKGKKKVFKRPSTKKKGKKQEVKKKGESEKKKHPFAHQVLKSSFRKRKCDAAYHSAKKKALAQGLTKEEACQAGADASAAVAWKIQNGELKEE